MKIKMKDGVIIEMAQYPDECSVCQRKVEVKPLDMINKDGKITYWGCALCEDCLNSIQNFEKSKYTLKDVKGNFYELGIGKK